MNEEALRDHRTEHDPRILIDFEGLRDEFPQLREDELICGGMR